MYNGCFICFECCPTPPLPVECFVNNFLNTFPVASCSWPGHPCGEVIHKSNCSAVAVDLLLHEVCVEEEEQDW